MKTTEMKQPIEPMDTERGKPRRRSVFVGCFVVVLLFVVFVVASVVLFNKVIEKKFDFEVFKDKDTTEEPGKPDSVTPIPDLEDLTEFNVIEGSIAHLNIGVKPDVTDGDIERLNLYLSDTYFPNSSMYNIAYLNKNDPTSGEVIAVYNYNEYTGTDTLTILPKELRYPKGE